MVKRKLRDARVLVTGASSGIGRALVCELGRRGARILMTARREERLQHLQQDLAKSQIKTHYVAGDITDNGLRQSLLVAAVECFGGIDILVNNAGVGAVGKFIESDEARLREIMEVNFYIDICTSEIYGLENLGVNDGIPVLYSWPLYSYCTGTRY